jgi:hypothetical protein
MDLTLPVWVGVRDCFPTDRNIKGTTQLSTDWVVTVSIAAWILAAVCKCEAIKFDGADAEKTKMCCFLPSESVTGTT